MEILEEYVAMVEGAFNLESLPPFQYGGLAMQAEEISNPEVGKRFDAYLERVAGFVQPL